MYKVFVDNSVIIFLTQSDFETLEVTTPFFQTNDLKELKTRLNNSKKIIEPLYFLSEDPKKSRKKFFQSFLIIRAAGGIVQAGDLFLFIKRLGKWDLPKGKIEVGEKKKIAAVREIEEECGIIGPKIIKKLVKTHHIYTYKGKPAIKKTYWYHLNYEGNMNTTAQKEEDITEVKWFKQSDFERILSKSYLSIAEVIRVLEGKIGEQ